MYVQSRLKKLEKKFTEKQELHAVFTTNYYESEDEMKRVRDRILEDYLSTGAQKPMLNIFLTNFGDPGKEGFVYSYRPRSS